MRSGRRKAFHDPLVGQQTVEIDPQGSLLTASDPQGRKSFHHEWHESTRMNLRPEIIDGLSTRDNREIICLIVFMRTDAGFARCCARSHLTLVAQSDAA